VGSEGGRQGWAVRESCWARVAVCRWWWWALIALRGGQHSACLCCHLLWLSFVISRWWLWALIAIHHGGHSTCLRCFVLVLSGMVTWGMLAVNRQLAVNGGGVVLARWLVIEVEGTAYHIKHEPMTTTLLSLLLSLVCIAWLPCH